MKKIFYIIPAFVVCTAFGWIGLIFGFGNFDPIAWGYLFFSVLGSALLCMKKWWGGFVGAMTGGLILWHEYMMDSYAVVVSAVPLGIGVLVYYLVMLLVCYKANQIM